MKTICTHCISPSTMTSIAPDQQYCKRCRKTKDAELFIRDGRTWKMCARCTGKRSKKEQPSEPSVLVEVGSNTCTVTSEMVTVHKDGGQVLRYELPSEKIISLVILLLETDSPLSSALDGDTYETPVSAALLIGEKTTAAFCSDSPGVVQKYLEHMIALI